LHPDRTSGRISTSFVDFAAFSLELTSSKCFSKLAKKPRKVASGQKEMLMPIPARNRRRRPRQTATTMIAAISPVTVRSAVFWPAAATVWLKVDVVVPGSYLVVREEFPSR